MINFKLRTSRFAPCNCYVIKKWILNDKFSIKGQESKNKNQNWSSKVKSLSAFINVFKIENWKFIENSEFKVQNGFYDPNFIWTFLRHLIGLPIECRVNIGGFCFSVDDVGFGPTTSSMWPTRSTNWANRPSFYPKYK